MWRGLRWGRGCCEQLGVCYFTFHCTVILMLLFLCDVLLLYCQWLIAFSSQVAERSLNAPPCTGGEFAVDENLMWRMLLVCCAALCTGPVAHCHFFG